MPPVVWWIRRDLRLENNPALKQALQSGFPVIPVFVLDDRLLSKPATNRQRFLISGLHEISLALEGRGSGLVIRKGNPLHELRTLIQETGAWMIFAEEDFTPFARKRDEEVSRYLPLQLVNGLTIFHPSSVHKKDGKPYTLFTPFSRVWKSLPYAGVSSYEVPISFPLINLPPSIPFPVIDPVPGFPAGEEEAARRLDGFLSSRIYQYTNARNRMDISGTSALSPYFRFGMISPAAVANRVRLVIDQTPNSMVNFGPQTWLNELVWREFYLSILFHFPMVLKEAFNPKLHQIAWRDSPSDLQAWKNGQTGYPVVDAAMRQLKKTGWMHNRARMITASFLTKDLLINWQEGERWFMQQLVDGDPAANNGGWQWSAGTGTDAAPYFRIFNPVLQSKKFDPHGEYIRRWVQELRAVPDEWLHEPWKMPESVQISTGVRIGKSYPHPIVDHAIVKDRALSAYKLSQINFAKNPE